MKQRNDLWLGKIGRERWVKLAKLLAGKESFLFDQTLLSGESWGCNSGLNGQALGQ
jgi:hypothetical protein